MKFKELLKELDKLNFPKGQFAITGSGPLAIRGIREAEDLDLIVKKNLWNSLEKKQSSEEGMGPQVKVINLGKLQIISSPGSQKESDILIENSESIEGFPFINLKDLIKRKKSHGRRKDFEDIKLIEEYLKK